MNAAKREALEVALRRTLSFHLGTEVGMEEELLIGALLDAAEDGTLRDGQAVGREFEDYLPDIAAATQTQQGSLGSSSSSAEQQEDVELYEDILRWVQEKVDYDIVVSDLMSASRPSRLKLRDFVPTVVVYGHRTWLFSPVELLFHVVEGTLRTRISSRVSGVTSYLANFFSC